MAPTVQCRLGQDAGDAAATRPALELTAADYATLLRSAALDTAPQVARLLGGESAAGIRVAGAGQLPAIRAELRRLLDGIAATRLPDDLLLAIVLQRLDNVCATALEFGLNLYCAIDPGGEAEGAR